MSNNNPSTEDRKKDHIDLAFKSQMAKEEMDHRFYYEPLFEGHPDDDARPWGDIEVVGKKLQLPLWISSMTGGTGHAQTINRNLALGCQKFGIGMGLGSCRILMDDERHYQDFSIRSQMGSEVPLMANLGIAQLEEVFKNKKWAEVEAMMDRLDADGLIVHVNPLQEWFQPEGDHFYHAPIETIIQTIEASSKPIMVKEVGQGMGPKSLARLLELPLAAVDFGAGGGTNFSLLEALRSTPERMENMMPMARVGHSAVEMVDMANKAIDALGDERQCPLIIVSGGIRDFLDGYYCMQKLQMPAIYAQASAMLKRAMNDTTPLYDYLEHQKRGLQVAYHFLTVK